MELGSKTELAEKMVERIPAPVRQTPGYKLAVEESKKWLPTIVDGTKSPIDMLDKATVSPAHHNRINRAWKRRAHPNLRLHERARTGHALSAAFYSAATATRGCL